MIVNRISDRVVRIDAPAKINLYLEVLNKRQDGYHNINSVLQAVSLYDRLEFSVADEPGISIELKGKSTLSTGKDNLIALAYRLMKEEFDIDGGLNVILEKRVPLAAGLGGGSSDAAAAIMACNILFDLRLDKSQMMGLGARIGSDVPFFFTRGQAHVIGRGEIVEEIDLATDYEVILVNPGFAMSTAAGYATLKRGLTISKNPFNLAACPRAEELVRSLHLCGNDFEEVHLKSFPELVKIRDGLLRSGALLARISGSGPTVFGLFSGAPADLKGEKMEGKDWQIFTVLPVTLPSQD